MREPVIITPEIMAMLVRHEPDKTKHAKLLTDNLARQRIMSSTYEELQQHRERKAKRELDIPIASTEAEALIQDQARLAAAAQHVQNIGVITTFAKRARESAISAGATPKIAKATTIAIAEEVETAIANAMAMQE